MCSIDQLFQIVWEAVATAGSEEAVDLIAKTGIVCVLHDGHELDGVVAKVFDARQDVVGELLVGCDLWIGRGDANMSLVNPQALRLWWSLVLEDVALVLGWVPEASVVHGRYVQVLGNSSNPGWDTFLSVVGVGCDERDLGGLVRHEIDRRFS